MTRFPLICSISIALSGACPMPRAQSVTWRDVPMLRNGDWAMAYDHARERVVLFGGRGVYSAVSGRQTARNETWEWDGRQWRMSRPRHSPPGRQYHDMAWDPVRQTVLMFGGYDIGGAYFPQILYGDTWEWDGVDWRQLQPSSSPGPREGAAMATDLKRGYILLSGGDATIGGSLQSDTWIWDGVDWRQQSPRTVPLPRSKHRMAFCPRSGRVVMFGAMSGLGMNALNTWEWDGADWVLFPPEAEPKQMELGFPTPRSRQGFATDPVHGTVLMHHGTTAVWPDDTRTYSWDGKRWSLLQPAHVLPYKDFDYLATDWARKEIVSAQNIDYGPETWRSSTWIWDGADWTERQFWEFPLVEAGTMDVVHVSSRDRFLLVHRRWSSPDVETWVVEGETFRRLFPPQSVPYRWRPNLVYHAGLDRVVLHGGMGYPGVLDDTWLWDGVTWTQDKRTVGPALQYPAMVYDSKRQRVVLYDGGKQETWAYDASGWTKLPTQGAPSVRLPGRTAYDVRRDLVFLMGGVAPSGPNRQLGDTWTFDGSRWTQLQPVSQPPYFYVYVAAYHAGLGQVLAQDYWQTSGTTFAWDGQSWVPLKPTRAYQDGLVFYGQAMVYDPGRQCLRVFFPNATTGQRANQWSWEMFVESLFADAENVTTGGSATLHVELSGEAGRPWLLGLSRASRPGIPVRYDPGVGTVLLPLVPGPLLQMSLAANLGGVLDAQGKGSLTIPIPASPALVHFGFDAAAVTLDPSRGGVGAVTNGVRIEIVR